MVTSPPPNSVVVVGAGPAGLAAGAGLDARGFSSILIEQGPALISRRTSDARSVVSGTGGAGLFSDGKFSFYPSASRVWDIQPRQHLEEAYEWLREAVAPLGVLPPVLPAEAGSAAHTSTSHDSGFKRYPSIYMSIDKRIDLIHALSSQADSLQNNAQVSGIHASSNGGIDVHVQHDGHELLINTAAVIFAGGRFSPIHLPCIAPDISQKFRRLEVGVRIEQASKEFFLRSDEQLDSKLILPAGDKLEYRTFCCCRNGRTIVTDYDKLRSVSGHSDGPLTDRSNIGFNVRILDTELGLTLWQDLQHRLRRPDLPVSEPLSAFLGPAGRPQHDSRLARTLGDTLSLLLARGLSELRAYFPHALLSHATLIGPTVEGVGMYPLIRPDLRSQLAHVWVAGDAVGTFRGLTAAMISGYSAALAAAKSISCHSKFRAD